MRSNPILFYQCKILSFSFYFSSRTQRSIGSDSQGRVTAANNQRQLAGENKKPYNFLPLHVNTNKSSELLPPSSSAPATPAIITKETKKQSPGLRDALTPLVPAKDTPRPSRGGANRGPPVQRQHGRGEPRIDSSQVTLCGFFIFFVAFIFFCKFHLMICTLKDENVRVEH